MAGPPPPRRQGGGKNAKYVLAAAVLLLVFMVTTNHPAPSIPHHGTVQTEHDLPSKQAVVKGLVRGARGGSGGVTEWGGAEEASLSSLHSMGGGREEDTLDEMDRDAGGGGGEEEEESRPVEQRSLMAKSSPSDCKGDKCIAVVPEARYIQAFADPHGGAQSMGSLGIFPDRPLSVRIFVYEEEDVRGIIEATTGSKIHLALCSKGMWGTQVILHKFLQKSPLRTRDPARADFFFVPVYPKCLLDKQALGEEKVNRMYISLIQQMPYFRRSGGRDHVFVFPSGRGATVFRDWKDHISNSIFVSPEGHFTDNYADHTPYFDAWKDIVVPGRIDERKDGLLAAAKPMSQRGTLAIFYGTHQGKYPRMDIMKLQKKFPKQIKASCERTPNYFEFMGDSKFCFAPRGQSSWTLRFFEAFFAGCVPVILADNIELPWEDTIDYSTFTIKWPMTRINEDLVQYLSAIPDKRVEQMVAVGKSLRCLFVYHNDHTKCNAFTAFLWKLEGKKRVLRHSREVFWLHDGVQVDRKLQPISAWQGPFESKRMYWNAPTDKCYPKKCAWGGPNVCKTTDTALQCKGLDKDTKC